MNFINLIILFTFITKSQHRKEQEKDSSFKLESTTQFKELKNVQVEVEEFISNNIEENLNKVEAKVKSLTKELESKKEEYSTLDERIRFLDEQCRSQETGKKDLESNLDLMKKREQLEGYKEKLSKYQKSLEDMKFDELKKEFVSLQEERDQMLREVSIDRIYLIIYNNFIT